MDMEKLSGARKLYDKTLRCLLYLCAFSPVPCWCS